MIRMKIWDPFVRVFHWSVVTLFAANAAFVNDESKVHLWIGYTLISLVALRVIWGLTGTEYARFSSFRPSISAAKTQVKDVMAGRTRLHKGHTPLGAWMIYNLILTLGVIALSGYLMTTDMFWGVAWPEELHEAAVTWAELSVVLHIAAVIFESKRTKINLPLAMVTGYKEIPANRE